MLEIELILLFMIIAAVIAVHVKDLLSSIIAVGAVGVGLSLAFLVLKAPDLAMMQLVVEILSLVILVRATSRQDLPFSTSGRWLFNTLSTALFLVVFMAAAYFVLKYLPAFGNPVMRISKEYMEGGMAGISKGNIVSAIALDYRSLDTLGEAAIVFVAVVGVLAVARKIGRK